TLPPGLVGNDKGFSGVPLEPGDWNVTVGAKTRGQLVAQEVRIKVKPVIENLAAALNSRSECTTTESAPWTIDKTVKTDTYASVRSGHVGDGQSSVLTTGFDHGQYLNFRWRVDSETDGDFLIFRVDGVEQARISGKVEWETRAFWFPTVGHHVVEWAYEKNESNAVGEDAGWVDRWLSVGTELPVITAPKSLSEITGAPFSYQIDAKRDPYIYFAYWLPPGLMVDSATGLISGSVLQSGVSNVELIARNSAGSAFSP